MSNETDASRAEESAFVARLVARDESAYNELFELYERRVFGLVFRMLGKRSDAEEITQDVFVQVFRAIESFRGDSKLSTWLFRIAVNLSKNRMKSNARRGAGRELELDDVAERNAFSAAVGVSVGRVRRPDETVETEQLEALVRRAILELEPEHRQLVILRDVEDLSYEEIADVTGLALGTVKSRIHRGRAQLREHVERMMTARKRRPTE
ncbi:MAG: sigma-70 family RNA polymerase sigma factor [Myxococcales bacterium]|nr:sigma-70 family RNA polymerase sigma factor [Myxococcales bacterium]